MIKNLEDTNLAVKLMGVDRVVKTKTIYYTQATRVARMFERVEAELEGVWEDDANPFSRGPGAGGQCSARS